MEEGVFDPDDTENIVLSNENKLIPDYLKFAKEEKNYSLLVGIVFRRVVAKTATRVYDASHVFDTNSVVELKFCQRMNNPEKLKTMHLLIIEHMKYKLAVDKITIDIYKTERLNGHANLLNILFELKGNMLYYDFFTNSIFYLVEKTDKRPSHKKVTIIQ